MWQVNVDQDGHVWGKFIFQQKPADGKTTRWHNTVALPSGKVAKHPDKAVDKKTGAPLFQPNTSNYKAQLALFESEQHHPTLTAIREASEETGEPQASLSTQFNEYTLVLLNNGYHRFMTGGQYEQYLANAEGVKPPFICVTYVTFRRGVDMEADVRQFKSSSETSYAMWIRLDTLFPSRGTVEYDHFFEQVYKENKNYGVPETCQTIPAVGNFVMASYVIRTVNNDLEAVMAAAGALV
jgi:hypothetical protein